MVQDLSAGRSHHDLITLSERNKFSHISHANLAISNILTFVSENFNDTRYVVNSLSQNTSAAMLSVGGQMQQVFTYLFMSQVLKYMFRKSRFNFVCLWG